MDKGGPLDNRGRQLNARHTVHPGLRRFPAASGRRHSHPEEGLLPHCHRRAPPPQCSRRNGGHENGRGHQREEPLQCKEREMADVRDKMKKEVMERDRRVHWMTFME